MEKYEAAELEIIVLENTDVITASDPGGGGNDSGGWA